MSNQDQSEKLSFGPSKKDIQDAIKGLGTWFSQHIVGPITTFFEKLMKGTENLWTETSKSIVHAESAMTHTVAQVEMVVNDYESWSIHRKSAFRGELTTFSQGLLVWQRRFQKRRTVLILISTGRFTRSLRLMWARSQVSDFTVLTRCSAGIPTGRRSLGNSLIGSTNMFRSFRETLKLCVHPCSIPTTRNRGK